MRKQSIVAMALAVAMLTGAVDSPTPFGTQKAEASTKITTQKVYTQAEHEQYFINKAMEIRKALYGYSFPIKVNPYLTKATQGHANYIVVNDIHKKGLNSHYQDKNGIGFTGVNLLDRIKATGFTDFYEVGEVISLGRTRYATPEDVFNGFLASVPHRTLLIGPFYTDIGLSYTDGAYVVNHSFSMEVDGFWEGNAKIKGGTKTFPYNNQVNVPVKATQRPKSVTDETRVFGNFGFPISITWDSIKPSKPIYIDIYDSKGNLVPVFEQRGKPIIYDSDVSYVVPQSPLKYNEKYTVKASGETYDGKIENLTWSFTTMKDPSAPTTPQKPVETTKMTTFPDYNANVYWAQPFEWAVANGIIFGSLNNGVSYLDADKPLTETQMLSVFFRYFKPEELKSTQPSTSWSHNVNYTLAKKYNLPVKASESTSANKVLADKPITRGQFAQVLAMMHLGKNLSEKDAVEYLIKMGLSAQKDYADYQPNGSLTRGHAVTFLQRYNDMFAK